MITKVIRSFCSPNIIPKSIAGNMVSLKASNQSRLYGKLIRRDTLHSLLKNIKDRCY